MHYKNFKTVTYCVAGWVNHITEEELRDGCHLSGEARGHGEPYNL